MREEQEEAQRQTQTASQQQAQREAAFQSAGMQERVAAALASARDAGTRHAEAVQLTLANRQNNMHAYTALNPKVQGADEKTRDSIDKRADSFAVQQAEHASRAEQLANDIIASIQKATQDLAKQQQEEMKQAPLADRGQLEQHHEEQRRAMADLAEFATNELTEVRRRDDQNQREEHLGVSAALAKGAPQEIDAAFDKVDREVEKEHWREWNSRSQTQFADLIALTDAVDRRAQEIAGALNPKEADKWRSALGDLARNLDDAAISRIKLAGEKAAKPEDAANAMKGQLFEEMLNIDARVKDLLAKAQQMLQERGINAQAEFIAGDRVRFEGGHQKFSDGMIAYQNEQKRLQVLAVLEAKAGQESGEKLVANTDSQTVANAVELYKVIGEQLEEEIKQGTLLESQTDARAVELAIKYRDQEMTGQTRQDIERMTTSADYKSRLFIDGRSRELAEQGAVKVHTFTPNDVKVAPAANDVASQLQKEEIAKRVRDSTYHDSTKLAVTQQELKDAARRAAELRDEERERREKQH